MNYRNYSYKVYGNKKEVIDLINLMLFCKGKSLLSESASLDEMQSAIKEICQGELVSLKTLLNTAQRRNDKCECPFGWCGEIDWGEVKELHETLPYGPDKNYAIHFVYSSMELCGHFYLDFFRTFNNLDLEVSFFDEGCCDIGYKYQTQYVNEERKLYKRVLQACGDVADERLCKVLEEGFVDA